MSRPAHTHFARTLLAASLLLGAVPACSAGGFRLHRAPATDANGNVVYRPVYPPPGPRPATIVPGGYAGVVYPPVGFSRGVNPTTYTPGTCPAPRRWGWWRH